MPNSPQPHHALPASNRAIRHPLAQSPATRSQHARAMRAGVSTPDSGSATQTITQTPPQTTPLVLRLRAQSTLQSDEAEVEQRDASPRSQRRIQWSEDVIDNEHLNRKKSKVCCIFHKQKPVGESSDEDDSSSSDDDSDASSNSNDDGAARMAGNGRAKGRKGRGHQHDRNCGHEHGSSDGRTNRKPSPNAYERVPRYDVHPLKEQPS